MNKIKGQAGTKQPRRAKNAEPRIRREDRNPKITLEMIAAGAAIILDRCEDIVFADHIARDVFTAMSACSGQAKARD